MTIICGDDDDEDFVDNDFAGAGNDFSGNDIADDGCGVAEKRKVAAVPQFIEQCRCTIAQLHNAFRISQCRVQIVVQSLLKQQGKAKGSGGDDDIALCVWGQNSSLLESFRAHTGLHGMSKSPKDVMRFQAVSREMLISAFETGSRISVFQSRASRREREFLSFSLML